MSDKAYHDADGNPVSLFRLCCLEPSWARTRIESLEAQIEMFTKELSTLLKAKTISCTIPSATMKHEFQRHYRRGWEVGVDVERERRIKLVNLLKEAVLCPEIGCSLSDDIKAAIVEAEKLK